MRGESMFDGITRGTVAIEEMEIGMTRGRSRVFGEEEIRLFADLSTDCNPVHLDEDYAAETPFGRCIAHGMLTASLISAVIGEQLPGHGTIYMKQDLKFLAPVFPGDEVVAEVTVADIDHAKRRVTLDCLCRVGQKPVLKGAALVLAPSKKFD
jgi:3-hydroxybutyryl-CoA dehydratase